MDRIIVKSAPTWKTMGFKSEEEAIEYVQDVVDNPPKPGSAPSKRSFEKVYFSDGTSGNFVKEIVYDREATLDYDPDHQEDVAWRFLSPGARYIGIPEDKKIVGQAEFVNSDKKEAVTR